MWPTIQAAMKQVQAGVFTAQDYGNFSRWPRAARRSPRCMIGTRSCRPTSRQMVEATRKAAIMDGDFRVDVDENTPVSE